MCVWLQTCICVCVLWFQNMHSCLCVVWFQNMHSCLCVCDSKHAFARSKFNLLCCLAHVVGSVLFPDCPVQLAGISSWWRWRGVFDNWTSPYDFLPWLCLCTFIIHTYYWACTGVIKPLFLAHSSQIHFHSQLPSLVNEPVPETSELSILWLVCLCKTRHILST